MDERAWLADGPGVVVWENETFATESGHRPLYTLTQTLREALGG